MRRIKHCFIGAALTLALLLAGPLLLAACAGLQDSGTWRTADRSSAGHAPAPDQEKRAMVQVCGARAFNWRGYFSLHTWISTKEAGASRRNTLLRSSVALPNHAVGKDYLGNGIVSEVPGGTGYQLSLDGYLGVLAVVREGLELNILGLSLGMNPLGLGIKLPGIGELALLNTNPVPESDAAPSKTAAAGQVSQKTL